MSKYAFCTIYLAFGLEEIEEWNFMKWSLISSHRGFVSAIKYLFSLDFFPDFIFFLGFFFLLDEF
jgi:hypothetical protein